MNNRTEAQENMIQASQRTHEADAAFREVNLPDIRHLQRFLPFIYRVTRDYTNKGRGKFKNLALVCWHSLSSANYDHIRDALISEQQLRAERLAEGVDRRTTAGNQEYHHWVYKRVRGQLEALLGPLVLPPSSAFARAVQAQFTYIYHPGEASEMLQPDAQETVPWIAPLFDQSGFAYTIFQAVSLDRTALLRTRVLPPLFKDTSPHWYTIPLVLRLLHYVWTCLVTRVPSRTHARPDWLSTITLPDRRVITDESFNPEVSGINYGVTGHVVINWTRFLASPLYAAFTHHCLQGAGAIADEKLFATFDPETVQREVTRTLHLYGAKNCVTDPLTPTSTRSGQRELFVREVAFSDLTTMPFTIQKMLDEEEMAIRTRANIKQHEIKTFLNDMSEPLVFEEALTVLDPLVLQTKARLFDPLWFKKRRAQAAKAVARRKQQSTSTHSTHSTHNTHSTAQIYRFSFRPLDYITDPDVKASVWFPKDHVETVFAIKRQKQLYFTRPALLGEARQRCPSEVEAWTRSLDFLRVVESFYEHGDLAHLAEVKEVAKSNFFQNARIVFLEKVARDFLPEFISLDNVGYRELQRIKARAGQVFMRDNPDATTSKRWYYDHILKQARPHTDVTQVRRVARVLIPELSPEPQSVHFYTRSAIKTFLSIANKTAMSADLETLTHALGAAPYVIAWAKFCLDMHERGVEFSEEAYQAKTRWSPVEDFILFQSYSKFPRMKAKEWTALLTLLPNRDHITCRSRVNGVNALLCKTLTAARLARYKVGTMKGDPYRAKQAVFILALAHRVSGPKDHLLTLITSKLTPERLERITLPGKYRGSFFTSFAF